jgi:cellobiose phosphorylase
MIKALDDFLPVCKLKGDTNNEDRFRKKVEQLTASLEEHAWDGEWYLRAYFDSGETLGSRHNTECRIDSIAQSWSIISGAGNRERAEKAMNSLYRYLVREEDRIAMLLTPPFDRSEPDPGYIRGYLPGIRENGGQYTHAAVWAVIAFAKMNAGDQACRLFSLINPVTHTDSYPAIMKYKQEPYVICADVYSRYPHAGRGGWSWYTGSAAWMYAAGIEYILGLRKEGERLYIRPVIPAEWRRFSLSYRYGETTYMIEVENPKGVNSGDVSIMIDGMEYRYDHILLRDDGNFHNVLVTIQA